MLAQAGVRWVIFSDDPINDLGNGNPPTGAQLIDGLKQLVTRAHTAQVAFWCSTLTPFQGSGGWSAPGETARAAIITFIKSADSGCDAIVDQDSATHDPTKTTWYLPAFDAGDHLHPNEQGLQAIADAVKLEGFTAPTGAGGAVGSGRDWRRWRRERDLRGGRGRCGRCSIGRCEWRRRSRRGGRGGQHNTADGRRRRSRRDAGRRCHDARRRHVGPSRQRCRSDDAKRGQRRLQL